MIIRSMKSEDVARVAEIEKQCFSQPWSKEAFAAALTDANAVFLVGAELDENAKAELVLGYIGMYQSPPEGEITNVAVAKDFRGKGLGRQLVDAIKEKASEIGIREIYLEVRQSNESAIHVYGSAGFDEIGIRKGFYDFPKEDARIMKCEISQ